MRSEAKPRRQAHVGWIQKEVYMVRASNQGRRRPTRR